MHLVEFYCKMHAAMHLAKYIELHFTQWGGAMNIRMAACDGQF